ncbi:Hypothetical protein R9X50_00335700 [Acrodontium crateriforme]|uniref:F-box domain-containing protein n=1 Tax=Acrodontium crateriforme TaxID=150365 RepID=A0AAQ3M3G0_9PEZI|nr:Hypothetical protein R9X50_00335700 [Acrodontium crateriforme]
MELPRPVGLGLNTQIQPVFDPEAILSTAPASPLDDMERRKSIMPPPPGETTTIARSTSYAMAPPHSVLARMAFAPATQQTVTTVTTTTTVSLPPLVMNPPKDLAERDPRLYPLAFTPTPPSIKRFCLDLNGRPATFHEAEDPNETMRQYRTLQQKIEKHSGAIRKEEKMETFETPTRSSRQSQISKNTLGVRASTAPKRTATPPSIADAAEMADLHRKTKKPRSRMHRTPSELDEFPSLNQRAAFGAFAIPSNPSPITPDTETGIIRPALPPPKAGSSLRRRRSPTRPPKSRLQQLQREDDRESDKDADEFMKDDEFQEDDSQLGPPFYSMKGTQNGPLSEENISADAEEMTGTTATPPNGTDLDREGETEGFRLPQLSTLATSSQQDASLPSPGLSPITAAANLAPQQNAFDASFGDHNNENASVIPRLDLEDDSKTQSAQSFVSMSSTSLSSLSNTNQSHTPFSANRPTMMDIPTMVDAFDSMPEAMQTYVMYQLLRRCVKATLQTVASVVNPALKCDPFNILPPELGLNITRFLDAQSMCRAAQVSKKWRKLISTDERAWKDLLERDALVLPKDEIARAVREGWGWQHPGEDGYEEDLNDRIQRQTPEPISDPQQLNLTDDEETASSVVTSRAKRKSTKATSSKKNKRRAVQPTTTAVLKPVNSLSQVKRMIALNKGPIAVANAASHLQHPVVGLPSLRNMHLFKSLYQRHYLIRKAWMTEESRPQHLAFRAHHRHVVTCLLFDDDKILTGSDDTKINVYDTKTGRLRNRLEGHEGGVWALQYDGDTLVSGSTDRSVRVWDIQSGKCTQTFQGHTSTVRCLVILQPTEIGKEADGTPIIMPKEPLIITGSRDSTLRVWKLPVPGGRQIFQTGPPANDRDNPYFLRTLSGHHNSVRAIAAHGDTLISGSYDCTVRVWKISNGDLIHRLQGHAQKVYSVVLDHARNRCISGSMDNLVKVWDMTTGSCLFNLEGHTSLVGLLDLSHDRLVSAAADSTLRIWDPETGLCKATLSAHTGAITCFQHDGQKVISGSDRTLKMWNVKNGDCVRDLLTDLSGVWQVLDFGASRDGVPDEQRGRRIVVDSLGREIEDVEVASTTDAAAVTAAAA